MEPFGDAVVAGEAPQAGDLLTPSVERVAELSQWREPATTERSHVPQKTPSQFLAAFLVAAFLQQHIAEPLFEVINRL